MKIGVLSQAQEFFAPTADGYVKQDPNSTLSQASMFVGSIIGDGIEAMGCLLEDGTLLTTLHTIYDANQKKYYNYKNMYVYFVKGQELFRYKLDEIVVDGLGAYAYFGPSVTTYDYACLSLVEGNAVAELGGGLKLDTTNHFGSAFVSDPLKTLAVSGPVIRETTNGGYNAKRYFSISENDSAQGGNYAFQHLGNHPTMPGLSGQAAFPLPFENTLYSVHSGVDKRNNQSSGFKASELIATLSSISQSPTLSVAPSASYPGSQSFSYPPGFLPETNKNRAAYKSKLEKANSLNAAIGRTEVRMEKHTTSNYAARTVRELATHFPKLGLSILGNQEHTTTNKCLFKNISTGWYVCLDKHGNYNTVFNEKGHYVALDGTTDPQGKDNKYHFRNESAVTPTATSRPQIK